MKACSNSLIEQIIPSKLGLFIINYFMGWSYFKVFYSEDNLNYLEKTNPC